MTELKLEKRFNLDTTIKGNDDGLLTDFIVKVKVGKDVKIGTRWAHTVIRDIHDAIIEKLETVEHK